MAITGMHALLYTTEPDAVRDVLKDVLGFSYVDSGGGWLIFRLPPGEVGIHPADRPSHELSFMCEDLDATVAELQAKGVVFKSERHDETWGIVATMVLPGDLEVLLYQPRHPTAI